MKAAVACAAVFLAAGSLWIDTPGLQQDEALFGMAIYYPHTAVYKAKVFGREIPLMQLPYLGSLKALLYRPLFRLWSPSPASIRLPMVALGAAFILLTWLLLRRVATPWAATAAAALLALDPSLLWAVRCDWGPVAIQLALTAGATLAAAAGRAPLAFFLFGLALWNKAVFVWIFTGLAAAWAAVHRRLPGRRTLVLATVAFLLGAYPFLRFNASSRGRTVRETARFTLAGLPAKFQSLHAALEGRAVYGYLMRERDVTPTLPRSSATAWLLAAALPLALRTRSGRFFAVAAGTSWLFMALTVNGGESLHHTVLLWPWPQCLIALGAAEGCRMGWRRTAFAAIAVAVLLNAGVTTRHYELVVRNGADPPWSEAIHTLDRVLREERFSRIWVNDWGILDSLGVLGEGRRSLEASYSADLARVTSRKDWVIVGHVDRFQAFPGVNARLANVPGYRKETLRTITDRQGTPVFEIYRLAPDAVTR